MHDSHQKVLIYNYRKVLNNESWQELADQIEIEEQEKVMVHYPKLSLEMGPGMGMGMGMAMEKDLVAKDEENDLDRKIK